MQNAAYRSPCFASRPAAGLCALLAVVLAGVLSATAQTASSSASNPFYGSVNAPAPTAQAVRLSLDDAIRMGLEHNLGLVLQQQSQRVTEAQTLTAFNALLPDITAEAQTSVQQIDLLAIGFKPSLVTAFRPNVHISPIIKVDVTSAQLNLSQQLFNLAAYDAYRSAKQSVAGARLDTLNARGSVVIGVGTQYLKTLADAAQMDNTKALLQADQLLLRQVADQHEAGVATNLDELRARVQYQSQQQLLISAENAFEKDKIALTRQIGLDPAQKLELTDPAPYAEIATLPLDQVKQLAYSSRKDYLGLQSQVRAAELQRKAVRYERLPSLSFNGNYGVTGETHGLYHGTFLAGGSLSFPIFKEARLRGDREVADAQLGNLTAQIADLRVAIEAQLRDSLLDVQAANELVKVARSNVDLATETVQQATDRFAAGVDDNLPLVQAQATLAAAQSQLVNSLYQYNQAKLILARNSGVVETQYKVYLGR